DRAVWSDGRPRVKELADRSRPFLGSGQRLGGVHGIEAAVFLVAAGLRPWPRGQRDDFVVTGRAHANGQQRQNEQRQNKQVSSNHCRLLTDDAVLILAEREYDSVGEVLKRGVETELLGAAEESAATEKVIRRPDGRASERRPSDLHVHAGHPTVEFRKVLFDLGVIG